MSASLADKPFRAKIQQWPLLALNDGDALWWLTVAFGEQRTCAAEARGLHSTRMTHNGHGAPTLTDTDRRKSVILALGPAADRRVRFAPLL
jgi:hypothetical protein